MPLPIVFPTARAVTDEHRMMLITLGGTSAASARDRIATLAKRMSRPSHRYYSDKVVYVHGHARKFAREGDRIAAAVAKLVRSVRRRFGRELQLVFVGKSMGGCKLHDAARLLARQNIGVELFVGVDMSCHARRHYGRYMQYGRDALAFPDTVIEVLNFYQTKRYEIQTGHPAVWKTPHFCYEKRRRMCRDENINVNIDLFELDADGYRVFKNGHAYGHPLCRNVGHEDIDSCPALLAAIETVIYRRVIRDLT